MSTQSYSDDLAFKGFFLNLYDAGASVAGGKWRLPNRIVFCAASAVVSWVIFVRLAELLVG